MTDHMVFALCPEIHAGSDPVMKAYLHYVAFREPRVEYMSLKGVESYPLSYSAHIPYVGIKRLAKHVEINGILSELI